MAAQLAVDEAIALHAMAAIHGDAGLGKTFAVTYAYERATQERCWLEFPAKASTKQIVQELLHKITGAKLSGTRYDLQHELLEILGEKDRLIVVDEAQRLNHECFEFLRFLHDYR
jgi:DNA transposition AAA+ family ATPase